MMRHLALIWCSEAARYLFFGACTTLVNILCFSLLTHCGLHYQPANVLSWVAAVSFAFITNKYLVFHSRREASWRGELVRFFAARIATLLMELALMQLFVEMLCWEMTLSKLLVQVLVIAANYLLSRFLGLNSNKKRRDGMLEEELHFQLLRSFHFSNRAIVAQTSQLKLMPGQPKILLYLLEHDGAMAKEITEGCVLDKSTVTSLLARMAQQALIVRRPHARDRRAAMICLTEKGRRLAEEVHVICQRSDERALRGIDAQERQTLVRLLRQVSANLEEQA